MHTVTWNMKIRRQYGSTLPGSHFSKQIHRQTTKVSKEQNQTTPKRHFWWNVLKFISHIPLKMKQTKITKKFVYHKYLEHQIPNCFVSGPLVCILHVVLVWTLHGVLVCRLHGVLVWTLHGVLVLMLHGVLCAYCSVLMCSLLGVLVWTLHDPLVWKLHGVHTAQYAGVNVA